MPHFGTVLLLCVVVCCACVLAEGTAVDAGSCSHCAASNSLEGDEMELGHSDEIRQLLIEHIKKQILQKLRMRAPPVITKPVIPEVLLSKHLLDEYDDYYYNHMEFSRDDFYGRAEEVVIFPENTSTHNCYRREEAYPNSCFIFRLTRDVTSRSVKSAELWVYAIDNSTSNNTYTISEIIPDPRGDGDSVLERVVAVIDSGSSGWIKVELSLAVRTWTQRRHLTHAIQITCVGCDPSLEHPVSIEESNKPFLIVHTKAWRRSRITRSLTCQEGVTTCCKEIFRLHFAEIGWNDWIVQPEFYDANFCRGSCMSDISPPRYHHTTVIRRYIQSKGQDNSSASLCCVASRLKPLPILYVEQDSRIIKSVLPNMVVDSCECM